MSDERIQEAIELLKQIDDEKAALVVMPPDHSNFLQGNRSGLVNLALASLRAAQGEKQTFKDNPWLVLEDYDFPLSGIELDEEAHIYLPVTLTKWQSFTKDFCGAVVGSLVLAFILIGCITSIKWLISLFR